MDNSKKEQQHEPVLKEEVLEGLQVKKIAHLNRAKFIDATIGFGGHADAIIRAGGTVLGIDADSNTLKLTEARLRETAFLISNEKQEMSDARPNQNRKIQIPFILIHGNFRNIAVIAENNNYTEVDGVLFDLGVSTPQLTSDERGFSFQNKNAVLDMRIDPETQGVTGANLLNVLDKSALFKLFNQVLDFKIAKSLTSAVVKERVVKPLLTVRDFLLIIERIIPAKKGLHPGTLPFMALRMAVNSELENLQEALPIAFTLLKSGGRLAVISFHSGEDRIAKELFKTLVKRGEGRLINKKPIIPGEKELNANPKARSAKLRIIEKI